MHLTLIKGGRRPATTPPVPSSSYPALQSRTHPNLQIRYMVAEARERLGPKYRQLNDRSRNERAAESTLALLNYLCLHLDEPETLQRTCSVVTKSLADIVAQLEENKEAGL